MRQIVLGSVLFIAIGCGRGQALPSAPTSLAGGEAEGAGGGSAAAIVPVCGQTGGLAVHEWGTYTSVHASDGHALGGVHHEDEKLPSWVHRRQFAPQSYYFEELPEEPLEQLETPVLYFHSKQRAEVKVEISFPQGIVGEWFPEATAFAPPMQGMTRLGGGSMTWNVTLDPQLPVSSFLEVSPDEIWAPSRNVASTPLSSVGPGGVRETEQFIFYRGLARFEPQVRTAVASDGTITLVNASSEALPAVFILQAGSKTGGFMMLGPLGPRETLKTLPPRLELSLEGYVGAARAGLSAALGKTGLCPDEAQAMVNTWTRSWFRNEGLRVLYLAPRSWADNWLPTKVTPAPEQMVRTLVGRVELLTPSEELRLSAAVATAAAANGTVSVSSLGRFAEPRLARAIEQLTEPVALNLARSLRAEAHARP